MCGSSDTGPLPTAGRKTTHPQMWGQPPRQQTWGQPPPAVRRAAGPVIFRNTAQSAERSTDSPEPSAQSSPHRILSPPPWRTHLPDCECLRSQSLESLPHLSPRQSTPSARSRNIPVRACAHAAQLRTVRTPPPSSPVPRKQSLRRSTRRETSQ